MASNDKIEEEHQAGIVWGLAHAVTLLEEDDMPIPFTVMQALNDARRELRHIRGGAPLVPDLPDYDDGEDYKGECLIR